MRLQVVADVLCNGAASASLGDSKPGVELIRILAGIVQQWANTTSMVTDVTDVILALGSPFTELGRQHCTVEAMMRLLDRVDCGLKKHPEVTCCSDAEYIPVSGAGCFS